MEWQKVLLILICHCVQFRELLIIVALLAVIKLICHISIPADMGDGVKSSHVIHQLVKLLMNLELLFSALRRDARWIISCACAITAGKSTRV